MDETDGGVLSFLAGREVAETIILNRFHPVKADKMSSGSLKQHK